MSTPATPQAPADASRWRTRIVLVLFAAIVLPTGTAILYAFPPTEYSLIPCWFHLATRFHCPGCGATRCAHALLHGDIAQALAWNPMLVVALPFLAYFAAETYYVAWTGRRVVRRMPTWVVLLIVGTVLAYWVLRNIDAYPFTLLAPHALERQPA